MQLKRIRLKKCMSTCKPQIRHTRSTVFPCASYVESVAGADESVISSAGMDPKSSGGAPILPEAPTGLEITVGDREGELDISWDPVPNAKSYPIQRSSDPNTPANWTHAGTSTKSSTTIGRPSERHPLLVPRLLRRRPGPERLERSSHEDRTVAEGAHASLRAVRGHPCPLFR
jgi:hypothetical protein